MHSGTDQHIGTRPTHRGMSEICVALVSTNEPSQTQNDRPVKETKRQILTEGSTIAEIMLLEPCWGCLNSDLRSINEDKGTRL
jgi:hypothetical protein